MHMIRRLTRYDVLWLAWLGSFLVIEAAALRDAKRGNTLSEGVWWFLGIGRPMSRRVQAARFAGLAFTAWLVAHFWSGGRV
jgi:hypothetical protein